MTVTRESRRMSRVTPPSEIGVTFAVSHGTPSRPVPTRPMSVVQSGFSGAVRSALHLKSLTARTNAMPRWSR